MNKEVIKNAPRHGYINELALICNCSRKTVARALFEGHRGPKSNLVVQTYLIKYATNPNNDEKISIL